jgi:serine/threonine protein kinase/tetratricopeptide (TPR) repeat protein
MNEREIFIAALQHEDAAQRRAYLDRACGTDAALRQHLEGLLEICARASGFLESPPANLTVDQPLPEGAGTVIGPYKLLEQIGEGGFGVVYMAEQHEPIRRKVALKILKPGMDSRQVIARFEAERQALALMDHPNIAKVLDAGQTGSGRPYFVMDLIKGLPITEYCDQGQLTPRQRLELLVDVCQAVQHAHQKGIIHRDLKPSNVLVTLQDGKPLVKVIDFGIAKALGQQLTDKTVFTGFAQMIGTPLYMSPEQAALSNVDVDTRSDIYSLGVLLYELLTGTTPFDKERLKEVGYDEMRRIIREEEPPRPSTRISTLGKAASTVSTQRKSDSKRLSQLMRGEMDWIVMKALEKDRNRRYETASAFAADVQRYLHDEPVLACPPSAAYRLRKFVRRNKGLVLAATLVLAVLLVGIIGTTWGLVEASEAVDAEAAQRLTAEKAQKAAEADRDRAARARDRTRQALDQMTSDITGDSLTTQIDLSPQQKKFLTEVLQYYRDFAGEKTDDLAMYERSADAARRVGLIEWRLGRMEEAAAAFRQARDELAKLAVKFPDVPPNRSRLSANHHDLGIVLTALAQHREALQSFQAARKIREELVKEFPAVPKYRHWLAQTHEGLGSLFDDLDRDEEALNASRAALAMLEKLVDEFPDELNYRLSLASSLDNVGPTYGKLGQPKKELEAHQAAVTHLEKLLVDHPADPLLRQTLAKTHSNLGNLLRSRGQWKESLQSFLAAIVLQENLAAEFPGVPNCRHQLATSHLNLGILFRQLGQWKEAWEAVRKAQALNAKLATDFPAVPYFRRALAMSHTSLGDLLYREKPEEALATYRKGLELYKKLAAEVPTEPRYRDEMAVAQHNFAALLDRLGKRTQALDTMQTAVELRKNLVKEFPGSRGYRQHLAQAHNSLLILFKNNGMRTEALAAHREALRLQQKLVADFRAVPECRKELAVCHHAMGELLWDQGQWLEALKDYQVAITIRENLAAEFHDEPDYRKELAQDYLHLGGKLRELGQLKEAQKVSQAALDLCRDLVRDFPAVNEYRLYLAASYNNMALLHKLLGPVEQAQADFQAAREQIDRLVKEFPAMPAYQQELAEVLYNQANQFRLLDQGPEARAAFQAVLVVLEKLTADFPKVPAYRRELATTYNDLGWALTESGKLPEALATLRKALPLREQMAAEFPGLPGERISLAGTYCNLGHALKDKPAESLDWYAKAIACLEPLLNDKGQWVARANLFLGNTHLGRAEALAKLNRWAEAVEANRAALKVREKLAKDFPDPQNRAYLAAAHKLLGERLFQDPRTRTEALESFRAALKVQEKLVEDFPNVPAYRGNLATMHSDLGILLNGLGKWSEAEAAHRAELPHRQQLVKDFPAVPDHQINLGGCYCNLGNAIRDSGKPAESLEWYDKAIARLDPLLKDEKPWTGTVRLFAANSHTGKALALERLNRRAEAVEARRTAVALWEKLVEDSPAESKYRQNLAIGYANLGVGLRNLGKWSEAEDAHRAEMPHWENLIKDFPDVPDHQINRAGCCCNLGNAIRDGGKLEESLDWYAKALAFVEPFAVEKKPWSAWARLVKHHAHWGRAKVLDQLSRYAEAVADWDKTVELTDPNQRPLMQASRALARLRAGKVDDAMAEIAELTKLKGWTAVGWYTFARMYALASTKDKAKEEEYAQRAVALLRQAVQAGFKDVAQMKKDSNLDPLRQRDDFRKLMAELDKSP